MVHTKVNKSRIQWLDIARGICLILMIICHSFGGRRWGLFNGLTGCFFLVFFFFSSGLCFNPTAPISKYAKNNFKKLMIPYFLFSFFYFTVFFIRGQMWSYPIKRNLFQIFLSVLFSYSNTFTIGSFQTFGVGPVWFFTALYVALILYRLLTLLKNHSFYVICIAIAASISQKYFVLPFAFQAACIGCFFVWVGDVFRTKWFMLANWAEQISAIKLLLSSLIAFFLCSFVNNSLYLILPFPAVLDLGSNCYSFFTLPTSLLGFITVIFVSVFCLRTQIIHDFLSFYGKNSFYLLLLHSLDITMLRSFNSSSLVFLFATIMAYPSLLIVYQRTSTYLKATLFTNKK